MIRVARVVAHRLMGSNAIARARIFCWRKEIDNESRIQLQAEVDIESMSRQGYAMHQECDILVARGCTGGSEVCM